MTEDSERPTWREPLGAFAFVLVALFLATGIAANWSPLSPHLVAIAAAFFVGVPYLILRRKKADLHRFGIDLEVIPGRHILFGLAITVAIFPLFALGNHLWETQFLGRTLHFDVDNYRQWPAEIEGPLLIDTSVSGVQVRSASKRLHLMISSADSVTPEVIIKGDRPFAPAVSGAIVADGDGVGPDPGQLSSDTWRLGPTRANALGRATLSADDQPIGGELPRRLSIQIDSPPIDSSGAEKTSQGQPAFLAGAQPQPPDTTVTIKRTYWWIALWGLTHLLLIALPEEYFYRGYLQTRLADLLDRGESKRTILGFTKANWLTSALFAVGHVLIPIGGAFLVSRAAVFFPSLLFGWMRERTGSIIAPTVFHAGANMMVLLVTVHYF